MFCGCCARAAGAGTLARVSSQAGTKTPVEARAEVPGEQLVRVAVLPFD